jgi:hypothetical protein
VLIEIFFAFVGSPCLVNDHFVSNHIIGEITSLEFKYFQISYPWRRKTFRAISKVFTDNQATDFAEPKALALIQIVQYELALCYLKHGNDSNIKQDRSGLIGSIID